jgi:hypothetical protein
MEIFMSTDLKIRLKKANAVITGTGDTEVIDWIPALKATATEIQALNQLVNGTTFPRPIKSNPEAMKWEPEHEQVLYEHTEIVDGVEVIIPEETITVPAQWVGNITGFLGDVNTDVDPEGFLCVRLADYSYFDTGFMPDGIKPSTFTFVYATTGTII